MEVQSNNVESDSTNISKDQLKLEEQQSFDQET